MPPPIPGSKGSLAPLLLVATPPLLDPNFKKTVLFLARHDEDGAFGLVVNRPMRLEQADLGSLARSLEIRYGLTRAVPLHQGGPVEPERGWILHDSKRVWEGTEVVAPGIALSASREALAYFSGTERPEAFRTLVGYAGWAAGQLDAEIAQGAWETAPATAEVILTASPEGLWERTLTGLGVDPNRYVPPGGKAVH